ncbi:hypothetical protein CYMTET_18278 [Cymbomonas tetramitiformis]|uniref:Uncharacterized protein n=1 Tax=Cymbomonas tetramitiformis TaxID=36881 RepID=A0AAE0G9R7_9CHLO|nr:hypothetical protein CYMTET_18278 [Cymbomonas tetramitiformis]
MIRRQGPLRAALRVAWWRAPADVVAPGGASPLESTAEMSRACTAARTSLRMCSLRLLASESDPDLWAALRLRSARACVLRLPLDPVLGPRILFGNADAGGSLRLLPPWGAAAAVTAAAGTVAAVAAAALAPAAVAAVVTVAGTPATAAAVADAVDMAWGVQSLSSASSSEEEGEGGPLCQKAPAGG